MAKREGQTAFKNGDNLQTVTQYLIECLKQRGYNDHDALIMLASVGSVIKEFLKVELKDVDGKWR